MGGLIKVDVGHDRGWLAPAPAASIARIDAQLGRPADINDAGRSPEQADANYAAWLAYKNGTGPWAPYALPASESVHCWGYAADSDDWYDAHSASVWRENGWRQTARYNDDRDEPWHGEYFADLDQHRNDPAVPTPDLEEEMPIVYVDEKGVVYALNTLTGDRRRLSTLEWRSVRRAYAVAGRPVPLGKWDATLTGL